MATTIGFLLRDSQYKNPESDGEINSEIAGGLNRLEHAGSDIEKIIPKKGYNYLVESPRLP